MKDLENFLRKISGIDNLKGIFWSRFIIGLIFIIYGVLILKQISISNEDMTKISITLAFFGLGLMFILDGQSILREYFTTDKKREINKEQESLLIFSAKLFFIIGSILFFVKFYILESPSLYPMVIFLTLIFITIIFRKRILHLEVSRDKILVKMKEDQENDYKNLQSKQKEWDFEIKEVK